MKPLVSSVALLCALAISEAPSAQQAECSPFDAECVCQVLQGLEKQERVLFAPLGALPPLVDSSLRACLRALWRSPEGFELMYLRCLQNAGRSCGDAFEPRAFYLALGELAAIERPPPRPEPEIFAELYRARCDPDRGACRFVPVAAMRALRLLETLDAGNGRLIVPVPRAGLPAIIVGPERRVDVFESLYRAFLEGWPGTSSSNRGRASGE